VTDREALMAAVCVAPADDLPRLVFADWLDEHGEAELAAFIRADIAAAGLPRYDAKRLRFELIDKPKFEQTPALLSSLNPLPQGAVWLRPPLCRRGFPWAIEVNFAQSQALPEHVPYEQTTAERLVARIGSGPVEGLLGSQWKDHLTDFEISGYPIPESALMRVLETPFGSLQQFGVSNDALVLPLTAAVVRSKFFDRLRGFSASGLPLGRRFAEAIAARGRSSLTRLSLIRTRLSADALGIIVNAPAMANLEELWVGGDFQAAGALFQAVASSTAAGRLRVFAASGNSLAVGGAEALAATDRLIGLEELRLSACVVHAPEARILAASPILTKLRVLDLSRNPLGSEGAIAIARSPYLQNLRVLDLHYAQVGDAGFASILNSPLYDRLTYLDASNNTMTANMRQKLEARFKDRISI